MGWLFQLVGSFSKATVKRVEIQSCQHDPLLCFQIRLTHSLTSLTLNATTAASSHIFNFLRSRFSFYLYSDQDMYCINPISSPASFETMLHMATSNDTTYEEECRKNMDAYRTKENQSLLKSSLIGGFVASALANFVTYKYYQCLLTEHFCCLENAWHSQVVYSL